VGQVELPSREALWDALMTMLDRIIVLEAEVERLQRQIVGHCERIAKQSDLLSRRAEK
jgi:hypothetical protein